MSSIEVSTLKLAFGDRQVLAGLDLHVPSGAVTAVLGSSGCGKTTLLRAVAGLVRPSAGRIVIGGETVFGPGVWVRPEKRNVGVVPQEGALFPHLDVAGNVGFGLSGPAPQRRERVEQLLALVGMAGSGNRRPHELSGGMQQRVAVARALSRRPRVVLLDEPFSALDTGLRDEVRTDVFAAIRQDGATAVLVTHDQDEALGVADRVAVMRDGRIVQEGTPARIYHEPCDLDVARFVGEAIELPATIAATDPRVEAECALGTVAVRVVGTQIPWPGDTGTLVVRPEELRIARDDDRIPRGPQAGATVESIRYHGHDCLIRVRLASGHTMTVRTLGLPAVQPGATVTVALAADPVYLAPA